MKKIFIILMLMIVSLSLIRSDTEKLKLAIGYIPHIQFAPLYIAIDKGFYQEEGIDLSIEYGFGVDIFSLLDAEKIDLGLSDSDMLIISGSKGFKAGTVFQYYQKYPVTIVALKDKIKTPSDFSGKTIGTPDIAGSSNIGLSLFLAYYHLTDKTKRQKIGYTQIQSLFAEKVAGVVCFFNNEPIQMRLAGKDIIQWNVGDFSDMVGASFITGEKQYHQKKIILAKFIKATRKAMEWVVKHQTESFEITKKFLNGYDEKQKAFNLLCLAETVKLFENKNGYGYVDITKYQKSIDLLKELQLIDKSYQADQIVYKF